MVFLRIEWGRKEFFLPYLTFELPQSLPDEISSMTTLKKLYMCFNKLEVISFSNTVISFLLTSVQDSPFPFEWIDVSYWTEPWRKRFRCWTFFLFVDFFLWSQSPLRRKFLTLLNIWKSCDGFMWEPINCLSCQNLLVTSRSWSTCIVGLFAHFFYSNKNALSISHFRLLAFLWRIFFIEAQIVWKLFQSVLQNVRV